VFSATVWEDVAFGPVNLGVHEPELSRRVAAAWADEVLVIDGGRLLARGGAELLTDARVIGQGRLHYPTVSRIFMQLPHLCAGGTLPRTVDEAVALLRRRCPPE